MPPSRAASTVLARAASVKRMLALTLAALGPAVTSKMLFLKSATPLVNSTFPSLSINTPTANSATTLLNTLGAASSREFHATPPPKPVTALPRPISVALCTAHWLLGASPNTVCTRSPSVSNPRLSVLPFHGGLIPNQNWLVPRYPWSVSKSSSSQNAATKWCVLTLPPHHSNASSELFNTSTYEMSVPRPTAAIVRPLSSRLGANTVPGYRMEI